MSILQFSEHFQLIFDNSNVKNDKQIKQKMATVLSANFSELSNFSSSSFWGKPLWHQKLLVLTAKARRFCYVELFSISSQTFLELIFLTKIKKNVIETIGCFVYQLSKKYCIYYVSEQLKYCTQINQYWLNKNAYLNKVLDNSNFIYLFIYFFSLFLNS